MIEVTIHYPTNRTIGGPAGDRVRIQFALPKRPFLFWADREVGQYLKLPRGYGVAWRDYATARVLFAPMPFNVLVGVGIWLWFLTRYEIARKLCRICRRKEKNLVLEGH